MAERAELGYHRKNGGEFILDTDACDTAIGAMLSQMQDGQEVVLAHGSRCLNAAECNYCWQLCISWNIIGTICWGLR